MPVYVYIYIYIVRRVDYRDNIGFIIYTRYTLFFCVRFQWNIQTYWRLHSHNGTLYENCLEVLYNILYRGMLTRLTVHAVKPLYYIWCDYNTYRYTSSSGSNLFLQYSFIYVWIINIGDTRKLPIRGSWLISRAYL